jgi:pantoate--beta-alanine ligase
VKPQIFTGIQSLKEALAPYRLIGKTIGFVPTMGALHAGHARLLEVARESSDVVVTSIFVNPIQFDRKEDYERYGRCLEDDLRTCEDAGVDLVFAPDISEMYPDGASTFVEVHGLSDHFCGSSRPGHFRGVTTVVSKLFHIVGPDLAYFGEKDAQQLAIIQRMVRDLDFPIRIVPVSTVREPDGLALSSRNIRLSVDERKLAPKLYGALSAVAAALSGGERSAKAALSVGRRILDIPGISTDYFDLADPDTMQPVATIRDPVRVMGAIWIGGTRLIDNLLVPFLGGADATRTVGQ